VSDRPEDRIRELSTLPIWVAPMAGGPATAGLVAAAAQAGAFGFLAGGYKTAAAMRAEMDARFLLDHPDAPAGYPEINNATRPLRARSAAAGDPDRMSLYAGEGFRAASGRPAAEIIGQLAADVQAARARQAR
jgi:NAD(P)H-dependent flavin oxidoreductase YrpB (nitropropane dioxygenase family)